MQIGHVQRGLPAGARRRLTEHYGPDVAEWLSDVEATMASMASLWAIEVRGYHDAGWASVIATGVDASGRPVVLKAIPETDRYIREREALTHWAETPVCRLLRFDDSEQVLLLDSVAGVPGGAARPADHTKRVAEALPRLHQAEVTANSVVPLLIDYHRDGVIGCIEHRARRFRDQLGQRQIQRALEVCDDLCRRPSRQVMLHSDLYAENVLFDGDGRPVFIDPHAKVGSPAFDWAFWAVYYISIEGFAERAALCRVIAPEQYDEMLAWSLTLAVDGGLYYLDVVDERVDYMRSLLASEELAPLLR